MSPGQLRRQATIDEGWDVFLDWVRITYRQLTNQLKFVVPHLPLTLRGGGWKYNISRPARLSSLTDRITSDYYWEDRYPDVQDRLWIQGRADDTLEDTQNRQRYRTTYPHPGPTPLLWFVGETTPSVGIQLRALGSGAGYSKDSRGRRWQPGLGWVRS